MTFNKYIYKNNGRIIVHLLRGYCSTNLSNFNLMADVICEAFPQINREQLEIGKIFKSNRYDGFTIVVGSFETPSDFVVPEGWNEYTTMDYCW